MSNLTIISFLNQACLQHKILLLYNYHVKILNNHAIENNKNVFFSQKPMMTVLIEITFLKRKFKENKQS